MGQQKKAPSVRNVAKNSGKPHSTRPPYQRSQAKRQLPIEKLKLSPRHRRLLMKLVISPVTRLEADEITGTSNAHQYVRELCDNLGIKIHTKRYQKVDCDGFVTRPATYHLDPAFWLAALALIANTPSQENY